MRFLSLGLRLRWLRIMSTGRPVDASRKSLASKRRNGFGVCVSTNTSTSLSLFCSSRAVEPKSRSDRIPYFSCSVYLQAFNTSIHSSLDISYSVWCSKYTDFILIFQIICQLFSILLYAVYKLCLYYASVVLVAKIFKKVESAKKRTKKLVVKESSLFVLCLAHCLIKTGIFMTR